MSGMLEFWNNVKGQREKGNAATIDISDLTFFLFCLTIIPNPVSTGIPE
jgi:hypothetical protein